MRSIEDWVIHFQSVAGEEPLVIIVGNKIDLADQEPSKTAKLAQWAAVKGFLYTETSAATRKGVVELFQCVAGWIQRQSLAIRTPIGIAGTAVRNLTRKVNRLDTCC
jgi:GTPase SAR1 family protein